jgi:hypothetical protein
VTLPPQLQDLMQSLGGKTPQTPSVPGAQQAPSGAPSADQLLNFLLAP